MTATPVLLLLAGLLSACGEQTGGLSGPGVGAPAPTAAPINLVPDGYTGRFRAWTTVLESPAHGPQLCAGGIMESFPPQCGGPDVLGWTWVGLDHESASGTRWGFFIVTGTYDGSRFTLTEPATVAEPGAGLNTGPGEPNLTSPCPEPAGGWAPVDPDTATDSTLNAAMERASASPDYAGLWIDQHPVSGEAANDPRRLVLNVRYTGDLEAHERKLRQVWGGALCVSQARNREADLLEIQESVITIPGVTSAGIDVVANVLDVGIIVADEATQRSLDEKYGTGVVRLTGFLEPID